MWKKVVKSDRNITTTFYIIKQFIIILFDGLLNHSVQMKDDRATSDFME